MYCTNCGKENSDEAKFCKNCGSVILSDAKIKMNESECEKNQKSLQSEKRSLKFVQNNKWRVFVVLALVVAMVILICTIKGMLSKDNTNSEQEMSENVSVLVAEPTDPLDISYEEEQFFGNEVLDTYTIKSNYDTDGNQLSSIVYDANGLVAEESEYTYKGERLVEIDTIDSEGIYWKTEFEYDEEGYIYSETHYEHFPDKEYIVNPQYTAYYIYDDNGTLIEKQIIKGASSGTWLYSPDDREEEYRESSEYQSTALKYYKKYDENGRLIHYTEYDDAGNILLYEDYVNKITYDKYNREILCETYVGDVLRFSKKTEYYSYFDQNKEVISQEEITVPENSPLSENDSHQKEPLMSEMNSEQGIYVDKEDVEGEPLEGSAIENNEEMSEAELPQVRREEQIVHVEGSGWLDNEITEYDEDGNKIYVAADYGTWNILYDFYENGTPYAQYWYSMEGSLTSVVYFDERGNVVQEDYIEDETIYAYEYEYDKNGKILKKNSFWLDSNANFIFECCESYVYNSIGKLEMITLYYDEECQMPINTEYREYDENGELILNYIKDNSNNGKIVTKIEYDPDLKVRDEYYDTGHISFGHKEYNDHGDLMLETTYNETGDIIASKQYTYEYQYDDAGNLIEKVVYRNDERYLTLRWDYYWKEER